MTKKTDLYQVKRVKGPAWKHPKRLKSQERQRLDKIIREAARNGVTIDVHQGPPKGDSTDEE